MPADAGQAEEGQLVRVSALVSDDVQARNVEFSLDGVRVLTDGSFPFEHRFVTPPALRAAELPPPPPRKRYGRQLATTTPEYVITPRPGRDPRRS